MSRNTSTLKTANNILRYNLATTSAFTSGNSLFGGSLLRLVRDTNSLLYLFTNISQKTQSTNLLIQSIKIHTFRKLILSRFLIRSVGVIPLLFSKRTFLWHHDKLLTIELNRHTSDKVTVDDGDSLLNIRVKEVRHLRSELRVTSRQSLDLIDVITDD